MLSCNLPPALLAEYRGLLRAAAVTRRWNGYQSKSTKSWPWRRKFSRRSSKPRLFHHESLAITTQSSPLTHVCMNAVKESVWNLTLGENSLVASGIEPVTVLRLAFKPYALPTDLSRSSTLCSVVSFPCAHHTDQQEASRMSVSCFSCVSFVLETCLTFIDHSCQLVASRGSRVSENENQSVTKCQKTKIRVSEC